MDVPKGDRREEWSWSTTAKVVEKPLLRSRPTKQQLRVSNHASTAPIYQYKGIASVEERGGRELADSKESRR